MAAKPVIAVIDVGKTNKKLFLFDENYQIVYERSARFTETKDEDGDPCENLESLRLSVFDSLRSVFCKKEFELKAINFSTYGASFVYLDEDGMPLTPLYNYLKPFPEELSTEFFARYGGEEKLALETASPSLGSLNSGLQLYRISKERPALYNQIATALHLPQYMSYLITGQRATDLTSLGCHTMLWDFEKQDYHHWVKTEKLDQKFAPIVEGTAVTPASFPGNNYLVGPGLHDSSAALIPYLVNFQEPFVLISTGTWCISLNPFNDSPLTEAELQQDCLSYMHYQGRPVKASRLFAGKDHEEGVKKIAAHFGYDPVKYRTVNYDPALAARIEHSVHASANPCEVVFQQRELSKYDDDIHAYHQLIADIIVCQQHSTSLVLKGSKARRIFVDGGFGRNAVYMNMLAAAFPQMEIFAASMTQATALGAALAIHQSWNRLPVANDLIKLQYYAAPQLQSTVFGS